MIPSSDLFPAVPLDLLCLRIVPEHPQASEKEQYLLGRQRHLVRLALLLVQEDSARLVEAALQSSSPAVQQEVLALISDMDQFLLREIPCE